jgi:RNA polymerase sigma-70 factor, ECF subfamily
MANTNFDRPTPLPSRLRPIVPRPRVPARAPQVESPPANDAHAADHDRLEAAAREEARRNLDLMQRIAERDQAAIEELYDLYAGPVFAIAKRILKHAADAEDVVIDTFWELWRKADRYDPSRGSVVSYLLLLARSRAIDRSRQVRSQEVAKDRLEQEQKSVPVEENHDAAPPEIDLVLAERRAYLRKLLAELPEDRREAIELNFLKGLSHQQVAEALDVPLGTIKTRIRQGLIQLHEKLRIQGRGPSP